MRRPKYRPEERRPEEEATFEELPLLDTDCSVCGGQQRQSFGGATCNEGHGGADGVERRREPKPVEQVIEIITKEQPKKRSRLRPADVDERRRVKQQDEFAAALTQAREENEKRSAAFTTKEIAAAVETLEKHNRPRSDVGYSYAERNANGWQVHFFPVEAREVVTLHPDDPIWSGSSPCPIEPGAIVKLEPPAGANVEAVRTKLHALSAQQVVTAPAVKADRPVPLESIDSKMGPQRSIRGVTDEMVQEVDPSIHERVAAEVDEQLTAEGL